MKSSRVVDRRNSLRFSQGARNIVRAMYGGIRVMEVRVMEVRVMEVRVREVRVMEVRVRETRLYIEWRKN